MTRLTHDDEQHQADQFEDVIAALQRGATAPADSPLAPLTHKLLTAAQRAEPDPAFSRQLRRELLTKSTQVKKTRPPGIDAWLGRLRSATMRKTIYSLAGVAALFLIIFMAWNVGRLQGTRSSQAGASDQPAQVISQAATQPAATQPAQPTTAPTATDAPATSAPADATQMPEPTPVPAAQPGTTTVTEEAAADVPVPAVVPFPGGMGGGGGGGGGFAEGYYAGPFVDATLTLDAPLPTDTVATVYRSATNWEPQPVDADAVRAFAAAMGVSGELYFEWYQGMAEDGSADTSGNFPTVYRMFDGTRRIWAFAGGDMTYEETRLIAQAQVLPPLPADQRFAIAEQFARERGLLDFDYEMYASWGYEVQFRPRLDGRTITVPQVTIHVTGDGQVSMVSVHKVQVGEGVESAELRSAADAWQLVQDRLNDGLQYNIIATDPSYYMPNVPAGTKTNWQRDFAPGQTVTVSSWLQVYRQADGSGTPLLINDRNMRIEADRDTLETLANLATSGNMLRLSGTLGGTPEQLTLQLASYEAFSTSSDLYLTGVTRAVNGATYLELAGGFQVLLPNAPADLPVDENLSVYSWGMRLADDGCQAVLDWVSIDRLFVQPDPSFAPRDPYTNITGVTITDVALVYQMNYPGEVVSLTMVPYSTGSDAHLLPMWRFSGTTAAGDLVEFVVPALASLDIP